MLIRLVVTLGSLEHLVHQAPAELLDHQGIVDGADNQVRTLQAVSQVSQV